MAARGSPDVPAPIERSVVRSTAELVGHVVDLYVFAGLSTYHIARQLGVDRQRVNRMLRRAGVDIAPRGRGRPRPSTRERAPGEAELRRLYVDQRMTTPAIGRLLGIPERRVRIQLARYGIERRHRGGWDRADRLDVDRDEVEALYVHHALSADSAAAVIGVPLQAVLRSAHNHGLPVRPGCAAPEDATPVQLIQALYDDPWVPRTLLSHGVPIVRSSGTLCERFPNPTPLTPSLLRDLYLRCGLSSFQIELVTGQPSATILRKLEAAGVERRSRGGLSPFMTRWRRKRALLEGARAPLLEGLEGACVPDTEAAQMAEPSASAGASANGSESKTPGGSRQSGRPPPAESGEPARAALTARHTRSGVQGMAT